MELYDMLVIGTGPAGQKAAVQAAKLGKRVGIIER
jgi:NAD(P) transhydrogenase